MTATRVRDVSAEHGREAWLYTDGSVRDSKGRMLRRLPGTEGMTITPQSSPEMARIRRERKQEAALAAANALAVLEASSSPEEVRAIVGNDDLSAVRAIALGRTRAAMDADSPYGNAAADWVIVNTGLAEPRRAETPAGARVTVELGADALRELLQALRGRSDDVVDGEVEPDSRE